MNFPRDLGELVPQRFEQMQPPRERLAKSVEAKPIAVRRVDDGDLQGVLMKVVGLVVEQDRVPAS
jgi:hypothetical protein